ncbi:MAG: signal peptidase I [Patescibacteria group bacterium]
MKKILWSIFEVAETVIIAVVAVFIVRSFITQPFLVSGSSMEPSFKNGNYLLVDELTYRFRAPERGEVVVFKYPNDTNSYFIKRIIGLPGEMVRTGGGQVEVLKKDGKTIALDESYVSRESQGAEMEKTLAAGEYFVMGDNRDFSFDSRNWGPLPEDDLVGVVRFRLWPFNEAMAFSAPAYR